MRRILNHILLARLLVTVLLVAPPAAHASTAADTNSDTVRATATRGPVELIVTVDAKGIDVGTPLAVEILALAQRDVEVAMPLVEVEDGDTLGAFNVLEQHIRPDYPDGDGRVWSQRIVLDTFEAGMLAIPAVTARFTDRRGDIELAGSVTTDPIEIEVRSMAGTDATGLRDIRGPVTIRLADWGLWLLAGGGLLLLAGGLAVAVARRRTSAAPAPLPPHIRAQRELDALEAEGLLQQRSFQPYYVRLTDILRHYIEGRFGLLAPTRTTPEFLDDMRSSEALLHPQQEQLRGFLRIADLVKFARHEPPVGEGEQALHMARCFVVDTQPRPEPTEDAD